MTQSNNHLSFPYNPNTDNHYALGETQPDLYQCRVVVNLFGSEVEAAVYDVTQVEKGSNSGRFVNKEDQIIVSGLPMDLAIIYQADNSNPVAFNYGAASFFSTNIMKFFFWESNEVGSSQQTAGGQYCAITPNGDQTNIDCYFPCDAN